MEILPPPEADRAPKRARFVEDPAAPSKAEDSDIVELARVKQAGSQLAYLQAQLAASESLHAAYQGELKALAAQLGDVRRSHERSGKPLWKDADPAPLTAASRLPWRQRGGSEGPETFSDVEEEVLRRQPDAELVLELGGEQLEQEQQLLEQQQQQQPHPPPPQQQQEGGPEGRAPQGASTAPEAAAGPPGTAAAAAGSAPSEPGASGAATTLEAASAAAAGVLDGAAGAQGAADGGGGGCGARGRLEALEATCSAVAQDDMEAQGAVACLAGRAGKYYLRGIVVTLGRCTESKGEVDIDLTAEEAACGGGGAAARAGQADGPPPGPGVGFGGGPAAHGVSRRQALVRLGPDGQFRLVNAGRQAVLVNDVAVPQQHSSVLPHLSLLEVGGVRLLFLANQAAVARVVRRSAALVL